MTEDLQLPESSNTATTHNPLGHLETVHNGTDCLSSYYVHQEVFKVS